MQFIKTDDLVPGMRLAKPIYNKMGVLLYERETQLTQQGIISVRNFGLIGIYILEPAEPAPPLTKEELHFERFQTIHMFQLKDNMNWLAAGKEPDSLFNLAQAIIKSYGNINHRIIFTQNLRSSVDYCYKHSLNVAILSSMIASRLRFNYEQQLSVVYASLLHDIGMLKLPGTLVEKNVRNYTDSELSSINRLMQDGFQLLQPDLNPYQLPENSLRILGQITKEYFHPAVSRSESTKWLPGSRIIQVANEYDNLTAMSLNREPVSEISAIRFLNEYADMYDSNVIRALTECIHIIPRGSCVELTNGEKAMVVEANPSSFMNPVVLLFSNNKLCDLDNAAYRNSLQIVDIMKTMDNRIEIDRETLKQFSSDSKLQETLMKIHRQKSIIEKNQK